MTGTGVLVNFGVGQSSGDVTIRQSNETGFASLGAVAVAVLSRSLMFKRRVG